MRTASYLRLSRRIVAVLAAAGAAAACGTAKREPPRQYTEAEQRMLARFGPIGYELKVDAMQGEEFLGVTFYEVGKTWPFYSKATQTLRNESRMGKNGPIPEQVRITWRKSALVGSGPRNYDDYVDEIIGDEIIEVGSRIPQEVIDDLKRDPKGGLRLKFRMSRQGTLLGWDIEHRPQTRNYSQEEVRRRNLYFPPAYSHSGGDFKEARPAHYAWDGHDFRRLPEAVPTPLSAADQALLKQHDLMLVGKEGGIWTSPPTPPNYRSLWEKGWYIDRKTGNRIETDF